MSKIKINYICVECSYMSPKWLGKCPECENWNSFEEKEVGNEKKNEDLNTKDGAKLVSNIIETKYKRLSSGVSEFDRVMGGGITTGSLILIGGEPGIGKSTLLTNIVGKLSEKEKILYVSGEESIGQVGSRIKRLGFNSDKLYVYHEVIWENIKSEIKKIRPKVLVIDSIQTTLTREVAASPGTPSQIREVTYEILNYIKPEGITCFIVGHITKEGNIAGPKILEHMVDTVIYFEGDQYGQYRVLRSIKNRFGSTSEMGIFEMKDNGLHEVKNPSQYFLGESLKDSYGRSISTIVEGSRVLFVETQSLVVENKYGNGKRTTQGIDQNRLSMMMAIIEKYFGFNMSFNDVYLNIVGGIKLTNRDTDLAIIASLISSYRSTAIKDSTIFLGEVGLSGEVRTVPHIEMRLKEISQMNYRRVVLAAENAKKFKNKFQIEIIGITEANELENIMF